MKKLYSLLLALVCSVGLCSIPLSVSAESKPSGELFGTYQELNAPIYESSSNLPTGDALSSADVYVVTCGNSLYVKVKYLGNALWGDVASRCLIWKGSSVKTTISYYPSSTDNKMFFSTEELAANKLSSVGDAFELTVCPKAWAGDKADLTSKKISFTRQYINNLTEDNTAPVLDVDNTTFAENEDGTITVTFGAVTAADEVFYYVKDETNNTAYVSLTNTITFTKPTVQNGLTYTYKAYAVDFNGNMSAAKAYSLTMPFDSNLDLALGKTAPDVTAGYSNGSDTPEKAVNGKTDHWGTYGISDHTLNWWQINLGAKYLLNKIQLNLSTANTYKIEYSLDGNTWAQVVSTADQPISANTEYTHDGFVVAAQYVRFTALKNNMVAISSFKVFASGLAVSDTQNPVISSFTCTGTTITSASLKVVASDVDDNNNSTTLKYTLSETDNKIATQVVTPDATTGEFTISDLAVNTTYNFQLTVADPTGNAVSSELTVSPTFDPSVNLALNKPATAGYYQNANVASRANNDNLSDFWTSFGGAAENAWWHVDLGQSYILTSIEMLWNDATGQYTIYGSNDDETWNAIAVDKAAPAPQGTTTDPVNAAARYLKVKFTKPNVGIKNFIALGSAYATADATAPVISSFSIKSTDETSASLQVVASDKDDEGNSQAISYTISDIANGLAATAVTPDADGNFTVADLKTNTTYNFTLTVTDPANNTTTASLKVQPTFNPSVNLALHKTTYAGYEAEGGKDAAVDGKPGTRWSSFGAIHYSAENPNGEDWWYVDLGESYNISKVNIWFENACPTDYDILGSNDASNWTVLGTYTSTPNTGNEATDVNTYEFSNPNVRYVKIFARKGYNNLAYGISIFEFEVYGSGYDTYTRNTTVGKFGTLCLPYDATVSGATLYTIVGKAGDDASLSSITLQEVEGHEAGAGKAYIFKATADQLTAINTGVSSFGTNAGLVGNLKAEAIYVPYLNSENNYVVSNNKLYKVDSDVTIGQYRAYINAEGIVNEDPQSDSPLRRIIISLDGEEVATGVETAEAAEMTDTVKFFSNGQLFIRKNGHIFNALGQEVK